MGETRLFSGLNAEMVADEKKCLPRLYFLLVRVHFGPLHVVVLVLSSSLRNHSLSLSWQIFLPPLLGNSLLLRGKLSRRPTGSILLVSSVPPSVPSSFLSPSSTSSSFVSASSLLRTIAILLFKSTFSLSSLTPSFGGLPSSSTIPPDSFPSFMKSNQIEFGGVWQIVTPYHGLALIGKVLARR